MMDSYIGTFKWYFVATFSRFIQGIVHLTLHFMQNGRKQTVPMAENPILFMSASKIAEQIREGKLLSEDVVKCVIQRIREVNPYINAVAEKRFDEALSEARSADLYIESKVKSPQELAAEKPLLGVPVSFKMLFDVKGLRCNGGSLAYKENVAEKDAQVVTLMKHAGAICLLTTNSPEFGLNLETYNNVYGLTKNPHDFRRTAGGSSGGEAALISAAGSILGVGNDLLGSLRFPALCTGIFSHKPTNGIVSNDGTFPYPNEEFLWHVCAGPMCRYAEDLALAMGVILDTGICRTKINSTVDFSSIKVYYIEDDGGNPTTPLPDTEVLSAQQKVITHFRKSFGTVAQRVTIRNLKHSTQMAISVALKKLKRSVKETLYGEESDISPPTELLKCLGRRSEITLPLALALNVHSAPLILLDDETAEKNSKSLEEEMNHFLTESSVLITPTFPKPAVYHYETPLLTLGTNYTSVCNLLGYPATQCPIGTNADGLPLGIQIIGAKECDYLTLAFAREIEKAFGGWVVPNIQE